MPVTTHPIASKMKPLHPSTIQSWHAHVYFDADSRDAAWSLREVIEAELAGRIEMGRFHEKPVYYQGQDRWSDLPPEFRGRRRGR